MASQFYPEIKNLFANLKGRKPRYSPEDIAEQFVLYVDDLAQHPIETETEYRRMNSDNERQHQKRKQSYARPPKVYDFVVRWLGMTKQWWSTLPHQKRGAEYSAVIERITQYCSDAKFDGAVVGLYNANIIARDLGLKDNIAVSKPSETDMMTEADIDAEIRRLEKLDSK